MFLFWNTACCCLNILTYSAAKEVKARVELPVYLNTVRDQVIFFARFDPGALTGDVYYKRGVALLCASLSGMTVE